MGFFDKVKKFMGKTGAKLEFTWIENPFSFGDPMIKATLQVTAEKSAITVIGTTGTFYATLEDAEGSEIDVELGEAIETVNDCASVDRDGESVPEFPHKLKPGESGQYGLFIMDIDVKSKLEKYGVTDAESAESKGVKFYLEGEADIKGTADLFDPSIKQEIEVVWAVNRNL